MTPDSELRSELNRLDIRQLRRIQLDGGRASLDRDFVDFWAKQNKRAEQILEDPQHGVALKRLAAFLKAITASLAALALDRLPTYYPYTDVHLLDWFIGKSHERFSILKAAAVTGIYHLIKDLVDYEAHSLAGFRNCNKLNFDKDTAIKRLQILGELSKACGDFGSELITNRWPPDYDTQHFAALGGYAEEPHRISGLLHFSCFPQTRFHDEVLFLRAIHLSELCFFGIRLSTIEAVENLRYADPAGACEALRGACAFAVILQKGFKVLRTMPPESFKNFREATGKASAIQSRNYQLMEVYFRGLHSQKSEQFARIEHLRFLDQFRHKCFLHLGLALDRYGATPDVMRAAQDLDKKLLAWRGLHVAFAKLYLADISHGTGDTSGAPYLERFLNSGLFSDTELDLTTMEDLLPGISKLFEGVRVPSSKGIGLSSPNVPDTFPG
jgi:tryptophan 2,3-dioxygenase